MDDFHYLASKPQLTVEELLRKDADHEIDNLRVAYLEFLDKCAETACGVIDQQENEDVIPGDEDSEARAELTKRAMKLRRTSALFHSLGGVDEPGPGLQRWRENVKALARLPGREICGQRRKTKQPDAPLGGLVPH